MQGRQLVQGSGLQLETHYDRRLPPPPPRHRLLGLVVLSYREAIGGKRMCCEVMGGARGMPR